MTHCFVFILSEVFLAVYRPRSISRVQKPLITDSGTENNGALLELRLPCSKSGGHNREVGRRDCATARLHLACSYHRGCTKTPVIYGLSSGNGFWVKSPVWICRSILVGCRIQWEATKNFQTDGSLDATLKLYPFFLAVVKPSGRSV